jgi:predicted dithiol-disulfide oxidoreductase (DUF899 family)
MSEHESPADRPTVVDADEWRAAVDALLVQEKELTRQKDAVAAARRRLPMTLVDPGYRFEGADGAPTLLELFDGRSQLITYHFMFGEDWDEGCVGCSWVVDAMSHPAHLNARDTSLVLVSLAPLTNLLAYRDRMGWDLPWYSSSGSSFNVDMGATVEGEEHHGLSVFLRDGDDVYRTYFTGDRGIEHLGSHWTYLDLLPYGRQEPWEDSPAGWPQSAAYEWHRRHDDY